MAKPPPRPDLPSREDILAFVAGSAVPVGKREIARHFKLKGPDRVVLKKLLRELESEGLLDRGRKRRLAPPGSLPEVTVLEVIGPDIDGELIARPANWGRAPGQDGEPPTVYLVPDRRGAGRLSALGSGERVLARLRRLDQTSYEASIIRHLPSVARRLLGVYTRLGSGPEAVGRITPTDRKVKREFEVLARDAGDATSGDLVLAEVLSGTRRGHPGARVLERYASMNDPRAISLIAVHTHGIPVEFPPDALAQAAEARPVAADGRVDLTGLPLVTIDGEDARDFDDAVWAEPVREPGSSDAWHLVVAIADVSWYVRPGDAIDRAAERRGTSVYFPDRVIPMLPEALSNDLCSLRPHEARACVACHLWIDQQGVLQRYRFERALMRSAARLTYNQVQAALDGAPDDVCEGLLEPVIRPLYGAFQALAAARAKRGTLEIEMPERQVQIDETGRVARISPRARYDSHRLIEEFMIAANVAAAEQLEKLRLPCMYRVHDRPDRAKLDALSDFLATLGLKLVKGQVIKPQLFNRILSQVKEADEQAVVNEVILRSQAQAVYSPANIGHFGLGLRHYAHFTSPIRRYADLLVHRALVRGLDLGAGALPDRFEPQMHELGERISQLERRGETAERDAVTRYMAAYLSDRVGGQFSGRIQGVTKAGLFVRLDEIGAEGLVPISTLPDDYYDHDVARHSLVGRSFGRSYRLGDPVDIRLQEADAITGGLIFQLLAGGHAPEPRRPRRRGSRSKVQRRHSK
ncbi:MAG: ribonuclease R [Alphaproteobacteria bacterium]|nr:ribonuclease R [Alphaproteobacteria bacterium]